VRTSPEGTTFDLVVSPALAAAAERDGPLELRLGLQLLGSSNVTNAALAATAALLLGADEETIRGALERIPPPRRRVELIHRGRFQILDDTVGHPESISALFGVVDALRPRKLHIACAVRGMRGPEINRQLAAALSVLVATIRLSTLVITRSEDTADERNVVSDDEFDAFRSELAEAGTTFIENARLDEAVTLALDRAEEGDLVLLLGAQGMDAGAAIAQDWLARVGEG
jgi:UDP-N-acetylmuramoyl-L-alanyl-D-glutamate--2,6-diaminopimelate ligase